MSYLPLLSNVNWYLISFFFFSFNHFYISDWLIFAFINYTSLKERDKISLSVWLLKIFCPQILTLLFFPNFHLFFFIGLPRRCFCWCYCFSTYIMFFSFMSHDMMFSKLSHLIHFFVLFFLSFLLINANDFFYIFHWQSRKK